MIQEEGITSRVDDSPNGRKTEDEEDHHDEKKFTAPARDERPLFQSRNLRLAYSEGYPERLFATGGTATLQPLA